MSDRYDQLKAQFTKEIIGDGNTDRAAVERKITRLRDDFFEKEERLMQSVKDVKADQDPQLKERAVGRLQEEKAALDDAILDILENQKNVTLPRIDEVTHATRKALNIPHRQAAIAPAAVKATFFLVLITVGYLGLISASTYLQSKKRQLQSYYGSPINTETSFGDYIAYVLDADIFKFNSLNSIVSLLILLIMSGAFWWWCFTYFRKVR